MDVEDIIFEEFMSRSVYLPHEGDKLMNFYATCDRKRLTTRLWLVGNSITRVCPYINEWGLHEIISSQKQGTIVTKEIKTDSEVIKIAIEYCQSTGQTSGTIGNNSKMINEGSWQSFPQPHLEKSLKEYKKLYKIGFQFKNFKFLADLLQDKTTKELVWYVYQYYKEFKNIIVISDVISQNPMIQRDLYNITIKNDKLKNLLNTFRESNVFYSTDLCGTDFKQVIDFSIRR